MTYFLNEPRSERQVERKKAKDETRERMNKKNDVQSGGKSRV